MPSIRVPLQIHCGHRWISPLRWEPRCVMCHAPTEAVASATLVNPNQFLRVWLLVFWSSERFVIVYPACRKHRRICGLLDWPARRGTIVSSVCWLLLPAVILLACVIGMTYLLPDLSVLVRQILVASLAIVLWSVMTVWYVAALLLKPVRLSGLRYETITLSIRSPEHFRRFVELNALDARPAIAKAAIATLEAESFPRSAPGDRMGKVAAPQVEQDLFNSAVLSEEQHRLLAMNGTEAIYFSDNVVIDHVKVTQVCFHSSLMSAIGNPLPTPGLIRDSRMLPRPIMGRMQELQWVDGNLFNRHHRWWLFFDAAIIEGAREIVAKLPS